MALIPFSRVEDMTTQEYFNSFLRSFTGDQPCGDIFDAFLGHLCTPTAVVDPKRFKRPTYNRSLFLQIEHNLAGYGLLNAIRIYLYLYCKRDIDLKGLRDEYYFDSFQYLVLPEIGEYSNDFLTIPKKPLLESLFLDVDLGTHKKILHNALQEHLLNDLIGIVIGYIIVPIEVAIKSIGMTLPPTLVRESESLKTKYFVNSLYFYNGVILNRSRAPEISRSIIRKICSDHVREAYIWYHGYPSANNKTEVVAKQRVKQLVELCYTDEEISSFYEITTWKSRWDLLRKMVLRK